MKKNIYFLVILSVFMYSKGYAQQSYFVSPKGKDTWPGTEKKPFATITKAQKAVRSHLSSSTEDVTVF